MGDIQVQNSTYLESIDAHPISRIAIDLVKKPIPDTYRRDYPGEIGEQTTGESMAYSTHTNAAKIDGEHIESRLGTALYDGG